MPFYPKQLASIGDHLRKKRLDLKLLQKDVARIIGADEASVVNWETNKATPSISFIPQIIQFLGYMPYDSTARSLGDRIRAAREALGLSQEDLARNLKIDPSTLGRWERGTTQPSEELFGRLNQFFNL